MVYSSVWATVALSGTHTQAALAAATDSAVMVLPVMLSGRRGVAPDADPRHDGLIEMEPRSERALIECAELPPRRTVMVDVPTTVCALTW
jgi:hypothetical protein